MCRSDRRLYYRVCCVYSVFDLVQKVINENAQSKTISKKVLVSDILSGGSSGHAV